MNLSRLLLPLAVACSMPAAELKVPELVATNDTGIHDAEGNATIYPNNSDEDRRPGIDVHCNDTQEAAADVLSTFFINSNDSMGTDNYWCPLTEDPSWCNSLTEGQNRELMEAVRDLHIQDERVLVQIKFLNWSEDIYEMKVFPFGADTSAEGGEHLRAATRIDPSHAFSEVWSVAGTIRNTTGATLVSDEAAAASTNTLDVMFNGDPYTNELAENPEATRREFREYIESKNGVASTFLAGLEQVEVIMPGACLPRQLHGYEEE